MIVDSLRVVNKSRKHVILFLLKTVLWETGLAGVWYVASFVFFLFFLSRGRTLKITPFFWPYANFGSCWAEVSRRFEEPVTPIG